MEALHSFYKSNMVCLNENTMETAKIWSFLKNNEEYIQRLSWVFADDYTV